MKKKPIWIALASIVLVAGVAYSAFGDKVEILGTSVSVGSADIKLLLDTAGPIDPPNLVDSKPGPTFEKISPFWSQDYTVKIFNNGTSVLDLTSSAYYETINDPDEIRQILFVEIFAWDDGNLNGTAEESEIGTSFGRKTIVKWKTEGFNLQNINPGTIRPYLLRFSTDSIPDSKQGASAVFDFEFDAIEL